MQYVQYIKYIVIVLLFVVSIAVLQFKLVLGVEELTLPKLVVPVLVGIVFAILLARIRILKDQAERNSAALEKYSAEIQEKNRQLRKALDEVRTLRGIIPICSYCKQIRNDRGLWEQIEEYVRQNSSAEFSHSICDSCLQKNFPEASSEVKNEKP